jgi:hypothetical protein
MARFEKTRIHPATAVLLLLALYALAGLGYAAWMHSTDAVMTWAVIGVVALIASFVYQRYVTQKRKRDR